MLSNLKPLHKQLKESRLEYWRKRSTDEIIASLKPGEEESLKVKADGTMMNGHHRIAILCERGVDVEQLPRELHEEDVTLKVEGD